MGGGGAQECSKENVNTKATKRGDKKEAAIPLGNNTTGCVFVPCKNKKVAQDLFVKTGTECENIVKLLSINIKSAEVHSYENQHG